MGTLNEDLSAIKEVEDKIVANKVARFAYTDEAYTTNDANGVAEYNVNNDQNIPTADASVLKVNETVLSRGYRAQASSVTRMLLNHFFGRMSYNLNKVNDIVSNLIATLIGHRGTANGFATLDENGRVPYSQLPESAMEYKGQWNAETNTPTLADGTGTKGDFYIVSVSGTQNLGSGNVQYFENDRIIYDGSVWSRLSAGDVKKVNSVLPTNGNVALTGENIPVSSTDSTLLSAPLTTDRYADSSVTNAKIKEPISVAKGGTGATDAKNGFTNLANELSEGANPIDTEHIIFQNENRKDWGLYTLFQFWEYIKSKISSVLGLTATQYNGNANTATTAESANKIEPNYTTSVALSEVTSETTKYIKIADCTWEQSGTLQVYIIGVYLVDTLVINFVGGNAATPVLCGYYKGNQHGVSSVIAQNGSAWNSDYSIYVKVRQQKDSTVNVALLKGSCTINITESTTAPTNISEWPTNYGLFGNLTGNVSGNSETAYNAYSGMVHFCYTHPERAAKTVTIPGFTLTRYVWIRVCFVSGNTAAYPTLNVNGTGAKEIRCARGRLDTAINNPHDVSVKKGGGVYTWDAGENTVLDLYYDGVDWRVIGDPIVKRMYVNEYRYNVTISGINTSGFLN